MSFITITANDAPAIAAQRSRITARNLFRLNLVGGGEPASAAISSALSRKVPSLTAENSGLTKKMILSKYSHDGFVTSTT